MGEGDALISSTVSTVHWLGDKGYQNGHVYPTDKFCVGSRTREGEITTLKNGGGLASSQTMMRTIFQLPSRRIY